VYDGFSPIVGFERLFSMFLRVVR